MQQQSLTQLAENLQATLLPQTQKQGGVPPVRHARKSEQALHALQRQAGFSQAVLQLIASDQVDENVRFAGVLLFKNFVKSRWAQTDVQDAIPTADKDAVKSVIVGLMISVPQRIQLQLSEALSIIADNDFPQQWGNLIDEFVSKLSPTNFVVNNGVLQTAHSIFKRWRHQFRSNALFSEINYVLERFCQPYMDLFVSTDALITANINDATQLPLYANTMLLLVKIFYSLNCQDIPEFFEDKQDVFFRIMLKYLSFTSSILATTDDEEAGVLEKIKTTICEVAIMYADKYSQEWQHLGQFVEATWVLLTSTGPQPKNDMLVSRAITLLTSVVRRASHRANFESPSTLTNIVQNIVLPNMRLRESDEELFEDDPIEYIRRDLEGSDSETRRRSASDLVKGLLEQFQGEVTGICRDYVNQFLQSYTQNNANWKDKDTALALFMAVASQSQSSALGATTTNAFLDVVQFFSASVFPDMQQSAKVHPILTVDALKFLYTFRSQLTKEQLLSVFPLLLQLLSSENYVVHTYAAVGIDKILSMKRDNAILFTPQDISPFVAPILTTIFTILNRQQTPEKLSENDYLMRTAMRVIGYAKQEIMPVLEQAISTLNKLVGLTSQNPSNPKFTHYIFESIGALIKNLCETNSTVVGQFEAFLMPTFHQILNSEIQEFIPYVFQIIAQMLEYHPRGTLPEAYTQILPPLLQPAMWETQGNIAALVRLLQAYLSRGSQQMVAGNQLPAILGIFQKLISSKANDQFGFQLLQSTIMSCDRAAWRGYMPKVFTLLLTRLSGSKTPKFTQGFLQFCCFYASVETPGQTPQDLVDVFESIQPGVFANMTKAVLVPALQDVGGRSERQTVTIGFAKLLNQTDYFFRPENQRVCAELLTNLLAFVNDTAADLDVQTAMPAVSIDGPATAAAAAGDDTLEALEEIGYQNAFSKLTAVPSVTLNPTPSIPDARTFFVATMQALVLREPTKFQAIVGMASTPELPKLMDALMASPAQPLR
ncbi:importin-alpha export receptor [Sorochytrium milnesiophthora]